MCSRKKKPYHNVASRWPFNFFDLSSSNLVQESSVDLWDNLNKVWGLPHNALHFPSFINIFYKDDQISSKVDIREVPRRPLYV